MQRKRVSAIKNNADYSDYINSNSNKLNPDDKKALIELKKAISIELDNKNSEMSLYLQQLSEKEKSILIAALITNDSDAFCRILSVPLQQNKNLHLHYLKYITLHHSENLSTSTNWVSDITSKIINQTFYDNEQLELPRVDKQRIARMAMELIPDTQISLNSKHNIISEIHKELKGILRVSHNEPAKPLDKNLYRGNITPKEYRVAVASNNLTYSSFVFLTLGLFQSALKDEGQSNMKVTLLKTIRNEYLALNYKKVIQLIKGTSNLQQEQLGDDRDLIWEKTNDTMKYGEILNEDQNNYSRRFFETRISQLYNGSPHINFQSIEKISNEFIKFTIHSIDDVDHVFLSLSELPHIEAINRMNELLARSENYNTRGRIAREGFSNKAKEMIGEASESALSKNRGILKANQPVPSDSKMISKSIFRNRGADITDFEPGSYAHNRAGAAYVTSISGHAFFMIALLEKYMEHHPEDEDLEIDVNQFIKAYISNYVSRGYHSLTEMMDPFNEKHIQEIFEKYNVKVDLNWPVDIIEQASKDTQEYTKQLLLKKHAHLELSLFTTKPNLSITKQKNIDETKKDIIFEKALKYLEEINVDERNELFNIESNPKKSKNSYHIVDILPADKSKSLSQDDKFILVLRQTDQLNLSEPKQYQCTVSIEQLQEFAKKFDNHHIKLTK